MNPEILTWARITAGLSRDDAARAVKLRPAFGKSGAERLLDLENGEVTPTPALLERMAKVYRRPLIVFFLRKPPPKADRGQDFRRVSGAPPRENEPLLDALIRDVRMRQGLVASLLEDEDAPKLEFIGSARTDMGAFAVANSIIESTGICLDKFRNKATLRESFAYLRLQIENAGMFVLLLGNLGSYHTNISSETFRGIVMSDPVAPFIVVNDQDAQYAWSFTVLHEVAHLWLGQSGVSSVFVDSPIEKFCSDVARRILLREGELLEMECVRRMPFEKAVATITCFANDRKISGAVVAHALLRVNLIDPQLWQDLKRHFYFEWQASLLSAREKRKKGDGCPIDHVVHTQELGQALISLVRRSLAGGEISYTRAAKILGVKARDVEPLLREAQP